MTALLALWLAVSTPQATPPPSLTTSVQTIAPTPDDTQFAFAIRKGTSMRLVTLGQFEHALRSCKLIRATFLDVPDGTLIVATCYTEFP